MCLHTIFGKVVYQIYANNFPAGSTQMVDEGYLDNDIRLQAIEEYKAWVENTAVSMTMKLNEVRGVF